MSLFSSDQLMKLNLQYVLDCEDVPINESVLSARVSISYETHFQ